MVGLDPNDSNFNELLKEGGEKQHAITVDEMPSHNHGNVPGNNALSRSGGDLWAFGNLTNITASAGGSQPHNNLQPYVVVYRWRRVA